VLSFKKDDTNIEVEMDFSKLQRYAVDQVDENTVKPWILGDKMFRMRTKDATTGETVERYGKTLEELTVRLGRRPGAADRFEKAAAYFRATFCKGLPF
jgi:hypothetical protein